jgi:molecular chaperone GrpE
MSDTGDDQAPEENDAPPGENDAAQTDAEDAIAAEAETGAADPADEEADQDEEDADQDDLVEEAPSPEPLLADLKDQLLRALAETENVRRRAAREKEDASRYAIANFARDMLDVSDNMHRALEATPEDSRTGDGPMATLCQGLEMTERELLAALDRHGIKKLDPMGQKFDHNLHQTMFEIPDDSVAAGTVVQVMQSGYVIGERLLRPAMVGIAKPGGAPAAADEKDAEPAEETSGDKLDTSA